MSCGCSRGPGSCRAGWPDRQALAYHFGVIRWMMLVARLADHQPSRPSTCCCAADQKYPREIKYRSRLYVQVSSDQKKLTAGTRCSARRTRWLTRSCARSSRSRSIISAPIVGFFPFERRRFGIGVPIGAGLSDCQGFIHAPAADWRPRELQRACRLSEWQFDHLVAVNYPLSVTFPRLRPRR
jgi:hypothetical protein